MSIKVLFRDLLSRSPLIDGLFRRFIWSRYHFPEFEMQFLNSLKAGSIDTAVDVGAAMGAYSWILNRVSRKVYAFEPGFIHYDYLKRVIFKSNIYLINAAVGSVCESVNMYTPGMDKNALHSATLSQKNPVTTHSETHVTQVNQITLDSYFIGKLTPDESIDLLKVDVEGYEFEVFSGAREVLLKYHPFIICEIEARHNVEYNRVFNLLEEMGYDCYIFKNGDFESFTGGFIEDLQLESDLNERLSSNYNPDNNRYINNFIFQHAQSRIKVKQ